MELYYNICILDDNGLVFDDLKFNLTEFLSEKGFVLTCTSVQSETDFEEQQAKILESNFLLIDYVFDQVDLGLEFIQKIRKIQPTVDIVFYSSLANKIEEFRQNESFDGIYYATRSNGNQEIIQKACQLLEKAIKDVEKPANFRGFVLHHVAILDDKIRNLIAGYSEIFLTEVKYRVLVETINVILNSEHARINQILKAFSLSIEHNFPKKVKHPDNVQSPAPEIAKEVLAEIELSTIANNHHLTDSSKNLRILASCLEKSDQKEKRAQLMDFQEKIYATRNILAHQTQNQENGEIYFGSENSKTLILNSDKCIEIRKTLVDFYDLLNSLDLILVEIKKQPSTIV